MMRLFLALAILAFAGGARAEEYVTITPCEGTATTDGGCFVPLQSTSSMSIAGWNKPASIAITMQGGILVTIHPDGTIEYGKDYTPDAAAKAFWDAIGLERKNRADK